MTPVGLAARRHWLILIVVIIGLALVPLIFSSSPDRTLAMRFMTFALLGVFWNISSGISGQFSFGHSAYFGIGAYAAAFFSVDLGFNPWVASLIAGGAAMIGGLCIGFLTFRYKLRDVYFALATFAIAELLRLIVIRFEPLNAGVGYRMPLVDNPGWASIQFAPADAEYYYIALILLSLALAGTIAMLQGRIGFRMVAVREDEEAAAAIGINPTYHKILALIVSAGGTGLVGALYFFYQLFIDPEIAFGPTISIQAILCAIIGGVGTVWGPVLGAGILILISEVSTSLTRSPPEILSFLLGRSGLDMVIYGIVLIVILLIVPRGLYGTIAARQARA